MIWWGTSSHSWVEDICLARASGQNELSRLKGWDEGMGWEGASLWSCQWIALLIKCRGGIKGQDGMSRRLWLAHMISEKKTGKPPSKGPTRPPPCSAQPSCRT
eukprot:scaffold34040_cov67-Isochrysis_galbana.AAC.1